MEDDSNRFQVPPPTTTTKEEIINFARDNFYMYNLIYMGKACEGAVLADFSCMEQCRENPRGEFQSDPSMLKGDISLQRVREVMKTNTWTQEQFECSLRCIPLKKATSRCIDLHQTKHARWFATNVQENVISSCEGTNIFDNSDKSEVTNPKECVEGIIKAFEEGYPVDIFPRSTAADVLLEAIKSMGQ